MQSQNGTRCSYSMPYLNLSILDLWWLNDTNAKKSKNLAHFLTVENAIKIMASKISYAVEKYHKTLYRKIVHRKHIYNMKGNLLGTPRGSNLKEFTMAIFGIQSGRIFNGWEI